MILEFLVIDSVPRAAANRGAAAEGGFGGQDRPQPTFIDGVVCHHYKFAASV